MAAEDLTDLLIVVVIVLGGLLLVWSRIMGQRVLDSLNEIRDFIAGWKEVPE